MPDNTIDIKGGNNQILPNAQEGKQYFIGDSAIKLALQHSEEPVETILETRTIPMIHPLSRLSMSSTGTTRNLKLRTLEPQ